MSKRLFCLISLFLLTAGAISASAEVVVGAERPELYMPLLEGKRVGLYTNHSGLVGGADGRLSLDCLIDSGIDVRVIFSPEHGLRGTADAGEHVASGVDPSTGLPVVSLFGRDYKKRMVDAVASVDVVVTDIQDVGLRYYTYYCTMLELMNAAARAGKEFVVLDRPNPLGMTIDGPILDMKYSSGVGRLPIPTVHGMTLGELACMIVGEGWLDGGSKELSLSVVPCEGYTHSTRYELPVAPSPNLPNMTAIYLYPSLCYFEATPVSLGRGTPWPFQVYGHPDMTDRIFSFTPSPRQGAKNPPLKGHLCHGEDLRDLDHELLIADGINLEYLIDAYTDLGLGDSFFTPFFEKLMGRGDIRAMIKRGDSAEQIKATWADDVEQFRLRRAPYLLYPE